MFISFTDQLNNKIEVSFPPKRIVSLVPSQTELLYSLGLDEEVVGITKFCIHPQAWFASKQRVGGTKTIKFDVVKDLQPDLVIANKEENVREQVEALRKIAPVWVSDISTLDEALEMIRLIGNLVNKSTRAVTIADEIISGFQQIPVAATKPDTAYLIWKDPLMVAAGDTFIHDIMGRIGCNNIFRDQLRYPQTTLEYLRENHCRLLLLSSEPYPFSEKHLVEMQADLPATAIVLVDGEMFSWYGSRLLQAPAYFKRLMKRISLGF